MSITRITIIRVFIMQLSEISKAFYATKNL